MTVHILVVCTANQCRSPMAAALFERELARLAVDASVESAGTNAIAGVAPTKEAIAAMADIGLEISEHRSAPVDPRSVRAADVVVTMTREHLRDVAVRAPDAFGRLFTLKELARRASDAAPRSAETIDEWLVRLGSSRSTTDLLGGDHDDDVDDPIGQPADVYAAVAGELETAVTRIVTAGWGSGAARFSRGSSPSAGELR